MAAAILLHAISFVPVILMGLWAAAYEGMTFGRLQQLQRSEDIDGLQRATATDGPAAERNQRQDIRRNPVPHAPIFANDQFIIHRMRGDSMSPVLLDGDLAVIDADDTDLSEAGIFASTDGSVITIYKTERVHNSCPLSIKCTPINPDYDAFEARLGIDIKIIGRVRRKITKI